MTIVLRYEGGNASPRNNSQRYGGDAGASPPRSLGRVVLNSIDTIFQGAPSQLVTLHPIGSYPAPCAIVNEKLVEMQLRNAQSLLLESIAQRYFRNKV